MGRSQRRGAARTRSPERAGHRAPSRWRAVPFLLLFLLLIAAFSWITSTRTFGTLIHDRLTRLIATLSGGILELCGDAAVSGNLLSFNDYHATVSGACDGLQPTYLYIAAVLAFPSGWRTKAWGLLIGIPAIFVVNLIRVLTIMVVGSYRPESVEWVHLYGWQALVILFTVALWVYWEEQFARPGRGALA